jgi:YidC/Oxa1 family membrane protein insertase
MDNQRLILWFALAAIVFVNFEMWQREFSPPEPPAAASAAGASPAAGGAAAAKPAPADDLPSIPAAAPAATPAATAATTPAAGASANAATPAPDTDAAAGGPTVRIRSDLLELEIAPQGVEIRRATLLKYSKQKDTPNDLVELFNDGTAADLSLFQWGLRGGGDPEPNHKAVFTTTATRFALKDGENELIVPFTWTNGAGLKVTRTLRLARGSYAIALDQHVDNDGATPWQGRAYERIVRHWHHVEASFWNRDPELTAFRGPVFSAGTKFQKLDIEKTDGDRPPKTTVTGGWAAAMQHYFIVALVPDPKAPQLYDLSSADQTFRFTVMGPTLEVAPGASADASATLYVGPKLQDELKAIAPMLDYAADYGRLTVIAQPLFWVLSKVQRLVGNWGLTIIIVTFLIKLVFFPLAQTSGRSMAKMRNLAPRMKTIQERFKDDREQLGKQMMELYKREKVNPLAGCLPIVVQIPVFIAFYWVLLESVELRQAPFLLWVHDLSTRDPYFVLPAIMGVAMYGQFKLNPTPPDPMQAKVFAFMPLIMTVMMAFFPAGLVLYWITNTTLSIAQQWHINNVVAADDKRTRT